MEDCLATGVSLRGHPVAFLRPRLKRKGVTDAATIRETSAKTNVLVAGIVLFRQQPQTAKGTIFLSLEDETGIVNLIVWKVVQEQCRRAVYTGNLLACRGEVQREGKVIHVVAEQIWDWSEQLASLNPERHLPTLPVVSRDFR